MPIQFRVPASPISGVKNLYFAKVTQNDKLGFTGEVPVPYPGVAQLTPALATQSANYEADNRDYAVNTFVNSSTLSVQIANVTSDFEKNVLGYVRKGFGSVMSNISGPEMMVKYEVTKNNGHSVFYQVASCKFAPAPITAQTQGSALKDVTVLSQVVAPINGDIGVVGYIAIDSEDPDIIAAGLTVQDLRDRIFGNFFWFFKPTTLTVTGNTTGNLAVAATRQLKVMANDAGTPVTNVDVTLQSTFVSDTPAKVTVSATGLLTGVAVGTAIITSTYQGLTQTYSVTVA